MRYSRLQIYRARKLKRFISDLVVKIQNHEVKELSIVDDVATATLNDDSEITVEVPSYETLKDDVGSTMDDQIRDGSLKVETPLPYSPPWVAHAAAVGRIGDTSAGILVCVYAAGRRRREAAAGAL